MSPCKIKKIQGFLGSEFKVVAHYGVELVFDSMDNITDGRKAVWQPQHGWLSEGQEYVLDRAMAEQVATLREKKKQQASEFKCPKCKNPLIHRTGTGKNNQPYDLFGCSGWPKCKETFNAKEGKPDFQG
jgi:predicted RNA-binding Zn-ribbon protein involved in translation (DUF1610 family)